MSISVWIPVCLLFYILYVVFQAQKMQRQQLIQQIIRQRRKLGGTAMNEAMQRFIGKDCIIDAMGKTILGKVEAIEGDRWLLVFQDNNAELINLDHITHVREHPLDKHGKKKTTFI